MVILVRPLSLIANMDVNNLQSVFMKLVKSDDLTNHGFIDVFPYLKWLRVIVITSWAYTNINKMVLTTK